MNYLKLPTRVFNSPLVRFANFKNGDNVNLIRLIKPYANGASYVVYVTNRTSNDNGLFKTMDQANKKFNLLLKNHSSELINSDYV